MHQPILPGRDHDIRVLCHHILEHGKPCGSPALHGESFCYYHHRAHQRVPTRSQRRARIRALQIAHKSFTIPRPATRSELQCCLTKVSTLIAANQIDLNRAAQLLAALDTAARNLIE